jgi:hypothetical protein
MISRGKTPIDAVECAGRAGNHAFGLIDAKAVGALRKLAEDIETGQVVLHSVSTSCHAAHEEYTIREVVVEVLEEYPTSGPRVVGE